MKLRNEKSTATDSWDLKLALYLPVTNGNAFKNVVCMVSAISLRLQDLAQCDICCQVANYLLTTAIHLRPFFILLHQFFILYYQHDGNAYDKPTKYIISD